MDDTGMRYADLAEKIRAGIAAGTYPVGARLPTETEMVKQFGVGRHTVREAIRCLREQGLVASRQGAGTIVIPRKTAETFWLEAQSIDDLVAYAAELHTEIGGIAMQQVTGTLARRIGAAPGEDWLVMHGIVRTRGDGSAVCASRHYIHRDFAGIGRLIARQTGPVFLLIEDMFAVHISTMDQDIRGAKMGAEEAKALDAPAGTAAIEVRRTYRLADGRIAQISFHTHPAEQFKQSLRMHRGKA